MKRAIVLSGGGSKGAYQIGFWKAIRELGITYDIVTGTSIGALNGAFMVQNTYNKAFKLWYFMDYNKVIDADINGSFYTPKGRREIVLKYAKGAAKGGLSVPALEKIITDNLNPDLFFSSKVDYGLVTVKFPSMKPVMLTKDKISKDLLPDYLLASASCFPAFKMKEINNESYIDGGYYDNMPINLAIQMGADEVIAVDLRAVGNKRKIKYPDIPITLISPKTDIGNFLVLEKEQSRRGIKLGYNDTMKAFNKLEGKLYTFKKGSLERNFNRLNKKFYEMFDLYLKDSINNPKYKKLIGENKLDEFNNIVENISSAFELDNTKIYRTSVVNAIIKRSYKSNKYKTFHAIKTAIKNNSLKSMFISRELICYIYDEMNKKNKKSKLLNNLSVLFPDAYMCALYLKVIL